MIKITNHQCIKNFVLIVSGLCLFIAIPLPLLIAEFVNTESYIDKSIPIKLNNFEHIDTKKYNTGFGRYKYIYHLQSGGTYYNLSYHMEKKNDLDNLYFYDKNIYILVNPLEYDRYKGTANDPIPAFNYSVFPYQYVWSKEKHKYNVQQYLTMERILYANLYDELIMFLIYFSIFPLVYFYFMGKHVKK